MPNWTFDLPAAPVLDLRVPSAHVELLAGPGDHASVALEANGRRAAALIEDSRVEVVGERLVVHVPAHSARRRNPVGLALAGAPRLRITVPEGTALEATLASADLRASVALRVATVKSASGDVRLEQVTGPVSARLASGDLHVGRVVGDLSATTASGDLRFDHVAGDVRVATASGDIRGGDVDGDAAARTTSGDLDVGRLAGDLRARTVSGDVSIGQLRRGETDIASTSGRLRIHVATGLELDLDVTTVSGTIRSDLDPGGAGGGGSSGGGTTGDGGDGPVDLRLRARTVSGDVAILRSHDIDMAATS